MYIYCWVWERASLSSSIVKTSGKFQWMVLTCQKLFINIWNLWLWPQGHGGHVKSFQTECYPIRKCYGYMNIFPFFSYYSAQIPFSAPQKSSMHICYCSLKCQLFSRVISVTVTCMYVENCMFINCI